MSKEPGEEIKIEHIKAKMELTITPGVSLTHFGDVIRGLGVDGWKLVYIEQPRRTRHQLEGPMPVQEVMLRFER